MAKSKQGNKGGNNGGNNGGNASRSNDVSSDVKDATRRATKQGKNKPSQPRTVTVSPTLLVKNYDAKEMIMRRAGNSNAVFRLRSGSPKCEVANLVIELYGKEERRSGSDPKEWHIARLSRATKATEEFLGGKWIMMNRRAFTDGVAIAIKALWEAHDHMEFHRKRESDSVELRIKRGLTNFDDIIARFTPPPVVVETEETEEVAEEETAEVAVA